MSRQLRVAVVGTGMAGKDIHAPSVSSLPGRYRLLGICGRDRTKTEAAAEELRCDAMVGLDALLGRAGELDLVVVASPPYLHAEHAIAALEAGCDVVVDKPFCVGLRQFDAMARAATDAGRKLMCFQNSRYLPDFLTVRDRIEGGGLGRVFLLERRVFSMEYVGTDTHDVNWTRERDKGGGWLLGWGSHHVDQVLKLFGPDYEQLFCHAEPTVWSDDADDFYKLAFKFHDGPTVTVDAAMGTPLSLPSWYVRGTNGVLIIDPDGAARIAEGDGEPATIPLEHASLPPGEAVDAGEPPDPSLVFYRDIHRWLTDEAPSPVPLAETRRLTETLEAAWKLAGLDRK